MNIFYIILFTLIAYSVISTLIYFISDENDYVIIVFGLGIFGLLLVGIVCITQKIQNMFKYHIGKRSIFKEESTGNKYKCKTKDTNDIDWISGYKLIKRYATKSEWIGIPDFSNEFIENSKKNCDNCKYYEICRCGYCYENIRCKHNEFGQVLEFNKFEKGK